MNCPNCSTKMIVEHTREVTISPGYNQYPETAENYREGRSVPAAIYYCEGCDSEWSWIKGVRGMHLIDKAFSKVDIPPMLIEDVTCSQDEER